jgi:hypothetical protein
MTDDAKTAESAEQRLPLFYKSLAPLDPRKHGSLRLKRKGDYGFARASAVVPLLCIEFGVAQKHYPIIFTRSTPHLPMALVGYQQNVNPQVKEDGSWTAGRYLPAYLRRYPFALVPTSRESSRMALCLDEESGLFEEGAEGLFFDGEAPSEKTKEILNFCTEFDRQLTLTQTFCARIAELGLLEDTRIRMRQAESSLDLQGFMAVSEKKVNALSDKDLLSLRPNGYLPVIYAHLMSLAGEQSVASQTKGVAQLAQDA